VNKDPFALKLFWAMTIGNPFRNDVFNTKLNSGVVVDTCIAYDTETWETGISRDKGSWIIVQQYESRELAEVGHQEWVVRLTSNPDMKLNDLDL
jgi:hypothetical protein